MIETYECTQCGSTNFEDDGKQRVRCSHCGSLFQLITDEPTLTIGEGANVTFGKNADVEVRGDIEIQDGANVDIQGKVTVLNGKKKKKFTLKLIEKK
jgi:predicted  nucleic acid-binding Zn-ribbon protein